MKQLVIALLIGLVIVSGCTSPETKPPVPDEARQQKIKELVIQLTGPQWNKHETALKTLVKLKAIPDIIKLLENADADIRRSAIEALDKLGAKESIPQIAKLLQDNDPGVRWAAVGTLGAFDAKESIPEIIKLLQDNEWCVRWPTVSALGKLGAKEAIPEITKLLQDDNKFVRHDAVVALRQLDAKEAIPEITKLIQDIDDWVRREARVTLKELGAENNPPAPQPVDETRQKEYTRGLILNFAPNSAVEYKQGCITISFELTNKSTEDVICKDWHTKDGPSNVLLYIRPKGTRQNEFSICEDPFNKSAVSYEIPYFTLKVNDKVNITSKFICNLPPGEYEIYGALANDRSVKTPTRFITLTKGELYKRPLKQVLIPDSDLPTQK
ncbi:MAG: HEAT repeat domain-containing protein [Candidatus Brocadiia bacterium]